MPWCAYGKSGSDHQDQEVLVHGDLDTNIGREPCQFLTWFSHNVIQTSHVPTILAKAFPSFQGRIIFLRMKQAFMIALLPILAMAAPLQLGKWCDSTSKSFLWKDSL